MKKFFIFLCALGLYFAGDLAAEAGTAVVKLNNGMKVILKKTSSKEDITIRLTALGGYSCLPPAQRAAGKFASQIAIRSGVGSYHFDQFSALLYDRSIEFNAEVLPFSRYVEGTAYMGEMNTLLDIIRLYFTQHHFERTSFDKVLEKAKEQIQHRTKHSSRQFEDTYISFVTGNNPAFAPIALRDVEKADFDQAKKFFDNSFEDPAEFVCVIVGAFDLDEMSKLVQTKLGAITKVKNHEPICRISDHALLKTGVKSKTVSKIRKDVDAMTRITFPVNMEITKENFVQAENLAHLIQLRLKKVLRNQYGTDSLIIGVTTEYPFYPCLTSPWITIQYHTQSNLVEPMRKTILKEIQHLQQESSTSEEIETMDRKYRQAQKVREKENSYWVMILSNYALWDWDLNHISSDLSPTSDPEKIKKNFRAFLSTENFCVISAS